MSFRILFAFVALFISSFAFAEQARLMRSPDIADDGRIVFTYEDDLWLLPAGGQKAIRLTSHPGRETMAKFSPDGKFIAYIGNYDGNTDIYVIPSTGGDPKRITYSPNWISICDWSADGKYIYIVTPKRRTYELFRIPAAGGAPLRIPIGRAWEATVRADGKIVYTPHSADRMSWRGYKGGLQQDLYLTDLTGAKRKKLTDWPGYDCKPLFFRNGFVYLSDREDGRMNLFFYDLAAGTSKRLTSAKEWDVEEPSVSANDVVFVSEGFLWKYDGASGAVSKVDVELESDHWLTRPYWAGPDALVNDVVPAPGGKQIYVETRGEIFLIDRAGDGDPVNLTNTPGSREILPEISPDGKTLAFYSDKTGEYELYVMEAKPGAKWRQITDGNKTFYYHCVWSPDGKRLLFGDKNYQIYWADAAGGTVTKVDRGTYQRDNEIYWEFSDYDWSADGKWIAYAKCNFNMNSSIYLYNVAEKRITRLTDDRFDNLSPVFDRNGKYLYFISYRNFEPELDPFMDNNIVPNASRIMAVQLQAGLPAPFTPEEAEAPNDPLKRGIELPDIERRIFMTSVEAGNYYKLTARSGMLFLLSKPAWGFPGDEVYMPKTVTPYTLESISAEGLTRTKILTGVSISYHVSPDGKFAGYLSAAAKGVVSTEKESHPGAGKLSWGGARLYVDPTAEFAQIFNDVYLQIRNFFYDGNFQGLDLPALAAKYRALLPYCATRQDVNYLLGKLNAEMGTSHMYVWRPGETSRQKYDRTGIGTLGADLVPDGKYYRFDHIVRTPNDDPESSNPLLSPGVKLAEGNYLIAIDGEQVTTDEDYGRHLVGKAGKKVTLTVNDRTSATGAWSFTIEAPGSEYAMRYKEMVEENYAKVREATGGKVGYMHLSDMDKEGLTEFERSFRAERFRDGLIIDVRDNGGGFVSWFVIDKLERKLTGMTRTREFEPMLYPHGVVRGPMVLLCNEGSGSDGDLVTWQFKDRKFGPVIGTRTWGGLIGIINFQDLIDGGMVTQVNVGFGDLDGKWIVENHGVDPDIVVENDPVDLEKGVDAQLDRAIEEARKLMKEKAAWDPKAPPYPHIKF